jgi:lipopolysaccharide biosynthesis glycosyltransferase
MLRSLFVNNPESQFVIYLLYSHLTARERNDLERTVAAQGQRLVFIYIRPGIFEKAAVFRHFSAEMYYRLVAYHYLPDNVERVLYLDPDIIVLNPIDTFYYHPFRQACFIAAEHEYSAKVARTFNKVRLGIPKAKGYYNTGVLLMNVKKLKNGRSVESIIEFAMKHRHQLLLPDQDIFNALYWDSIIAMPWIYYNYDARYYDLSKLLPSAGPEADLDWIKKHTVFLHFCGKQKPWQSKYKGELGFLFRRYAELVDEPLPEGQIHD